MIGAEGVAVDKCEVCGWYEALGLHHFVWATVRMAHRAESYIDVLERGEQYTGELEYVRGRYQATQSHQVNVEVGA
jgi:hypothetical protein